MLTTILQQIQQAIRFLITFTIITGILYPLLITGISQIIFPKQANGSLIEYQGKIIGSKLIGQQFSSDKFFWGRPSATAPFAYNAAHSTGSNLGPSNPILLDSIANRANAMRQKNPQALGAIPIDLITASASGLDPHITIESALYQVLRISKARRIPAQAINSLVNDLSEQYFFGVFGIKYVNVLQLNLALEQLSSQRMS